jgi:hypothetical protein
VGAWVRGCVGACAGGWVGVRGGLLAVVVIEDGVDEVLRVGRPLEAAARVDQRVLQHTPRAHVLDRDREVLRAAAAHARWAGGNVEACGGG